MNSRGFLPVLTICLTALAGCGPHQADLVITNALVWTGCPEAPHAQAIAIQGDRLALVGEKAKVRELVGSRTRVIDAQGRRVIPGLTDCHTHIINAGLQLGRLHLRQVADRNEFVAAVDEVARAADPGQWVLGGRWSVESWADPTPPTKTWIDPVTGDVPVFLVRMDGHQALANSAALRLAGIDASGPPDPSGGVIERDPATGEPTGILKDDAMDLVSDHIPELTGADREVALLRAMHHANRCGVTSVHDMSDPAHLPVFARVRDAGRATVRIRSFVMTEAWAPHHDTVRRFRNDEWVTVGGFKGFMDGSLGSRTACMHEPYADAAHDAKYPAGLLVAMADPPAKISRQISQADANGFQVVVHAIGDRANTLLLDAYEEAAEANGPYDRRHRIEHAQHLKPRDLGRFARLGVVASMQPLHKADDGRYADGALGPDRIRTSYAYRDLIDTGAHVCFGSDWPVVSVNPFAGMAAAVTARTLDGKVWVPEQAITVEEALRAYTVEAAYAGFAEANLGTLEPGKLADLVLLDADPWVVPADRLADIKPVMTIVGGRVVWSADQAGAES